MALLVACCCPVAAVAYADSGVLVSLSGVTTDEGIVVDAALIANSGLSALKLSLVYDKDAFEYVRCVNFEEALGTLSFTESGNEVDVDDIRFVYGPGNNDNSTGMLMRMLFATCDGVKAGDYRIGFVVEDAIATVNGSSVDVESTVYSAKVTVDSDGEIVIVTEQNNFDWTTAILVVVAVLLVVALAVLVALKSWQKNQQTNNWKRVD